MRKSNVHIDFFFLFLLQHTLFRYKNQERKLLAVSCYSPLWLFIFRIKSPWKAFSQQLLKLHSTQFPLESRNHLPILLQFLVQSSETDDGSFVEWLPWHCRALLPFIPTSVNIFPVMWKDIKVHVLTRMSTGKEALALVNTNLLC